MLSHEPRAATSFALLVPFNPLLHNSLIKFPIGVIACAVL